MGVKPAAMPLPVSNTMPTTMTATSNASPPLDISENETFAGLMRKTVAFARNHRSLNVVAFWVIFSLTDWLIQQPLEWLLLLFYSFIVLGRIRRLGFSTLFAYLIGLATADYLVFSLVPPEVTATAASVLVNTFVVLQVQGCNMRGLLLLALLIWSVFYKSPPSVSIYLRPVAVHCIAFGAGWLLFTAVAALYDSFDDLLLYTGAALADPPLAIVQELTATSLRVFWSYSPSSRKHIKEYIVEINGEICEHLPADVHSMWVRGLSPNERYRVRVAATSTHGSSFSTLVIVRTPPMSTSSSPPDLGEEEGLDSGRGSTDSLPSLIANDTSSAADGSGGHGRSVASTAMDLVMADDVPPPLTAATLTTNGPRDEHVVHEMQSELQQLQKQRLDTDAMIRELSVHYQAELQGFEAEAQRLREIKRSEDAPKHKLKQMLKGLEETKTKADLSKSKLEKELRSEEEHRDTLQAHLERLQAEQAAVIATLHELDQKQQVASVQQAIDRQALKAKVDAARQQASEAAVTVVGLHEQLQQLQEKISQASERVIVERSRLSSILETVAGVHTRESEKKNEVNHLYEHYTKLVEDNRMLQDHLREETHHKMALMAELGMARKKREQITMQQSFPRAYAPSFAPSTNLNHSNVYSNGYHGNGLYSNVNNTTNGTGNGGVYSNGLNGTMPSITSYGRARTTGSTPPATPSADSSSSAAASTTNSGRTSPDFSRRQSFHHSYSNPTLPSVLSGGKHSPGSRPVGSKDDIMYKNDPHGNTAGDGSGAPPVFNMRLSPYAWSHSSSS